MQSHIVSLLLYVSLCAGPPMIVSLTADVSCHSFPAGKLQAFPTPPYLIPCCCVRASLGACLQLCVHTCLFSQAGCLNRKSRLTSRRVLFTGFLSLPHSLSLSPLSFYFFKKYFCCWRLRRGNVTLYLLLHLVTAGDSCTYFWSTACLMQPPSQYSMLTMALSAGHVGSLSQQSSTHTL